MVAVSPEQLKREAVCYFREPKLPESLRWVADLDPVNARLFAVELSDAITKATIIDDFTALVALIECWRGTAEVNAVPGLVDEIVAPKEYARFET